jgi:MoxR-like ATPase
MSPATARRSRPVFGGATDPQGEPYDKLQPMVLAALEAGVPCFLHGHPGVGKSTLAAEIARDLNLPLVDIRLAQRDPAEIGGIYCPDKETQTLHHLAPAWVREVMEKPSFLFLDELNSGTTRLHQSIAYQIVLEKRIGPFVFHPGTVVLAAGNLEEDAAIVSPLSSALANRFVHFRLRPDAKCWLDWARDNGIHPQILAYLDEKQSLANQLLYENTGDAAFPSPRSWEMASKVLAVAPEGCERRLLTACIGAPAAEKLIAYLKLYHRLSPERIVRRFGDVDFTTKRNSDPSFIHATVSAVAGWVAEQDGFDPDWAPALVKFMESPGLDPEFVILFLRELRERTDALRHLKKLPSFRERCGDLVQLNLEMYR